MVFLIDNYDSFTYNIVQRFGEIDRTLEIEVARNDQVTLEEIAAKRPERIIISPGPCSPLEAGISMAVIKHFAPTVPILGVCLGHQCMGEVYDNRVVRAPRLMHGKVSQIHHDNQGIFAGLPNPFVATRYHSLCIPYGELNGGLKITAWTDDGDEPREVMGVRHNVYPIHGVQFHPESFLTEHGIELLKNFLKLPAAQW
jgi:anthranilate synthase/aminodeoxychorismate synthase-like glutamine amidotransferase